MLGRFGRFLHFFLLHIIAQYSVTILLYVPGTKKNREKSKKSKQKIQNSGCVFSLLSLIETNKQCLDAFRFVYKNMK